MKGWPTSAKIVQPRLPAPTHPPHTPFRDNLDLSPSSRYRAPVIYIWGQLGKLAPAYTGKFLPKPASPRQRESPGSQMQWGPAGRWDSDINEPCSQLPVHDPAIPGGFQHCEWHEYTAGDLERGWARIWALAPGVKCHLCRPSPESSTKTSWFHGTDQSRGGFCMYGSPLAPR